MSDEMRIRFLKLSDRGNSFSNDIVQVDAAEGFALVLAGAAVLDAQQSDPPFAILNEISERAIRLETLGPALVISEAFEAVEGEVLRNGVRQMLAKGHTLNWARDVDEAKQLVECQLSGCTERDSNLFEQFVKVMTKQIWTSPEVHIYEKVTDELRFEHRLVSQPSVGFTILADYTVMRQLDEEWWHFNVQFEEVTRKLQKTFSQGLFDGRIIVVEETPRAERMVAPKLAEKYVSSNENSSFYYLLSKDLPLSLFEPSVALAVKKAEAKRWLEIACTKLADQGLRPNGDDAQYVLSERFGLSPNAAKTVWSEANIPNRNQLGNIPRSKKASIELLRTL